MKRICIISDHHICTNPRVWKEASALSAAGYDVTEITVLTSASSLIKDEQIIKSIANFNYKAVLNLIPSNLSYFRLFFFKVRRKFFQVLKKLIGYDSPFLLGHSHQLFIEAAMAEKADLYICHIDFAQYIGVELLKKGKKVAFDFEDWYSKDYIHPLKPVKLLKKIERAALFNGAFCLTPSKAMAQSIASYYKLSKEPIVLYNGFPKTALKLNYDAKQPSIIWFSQTIGTDRGIEQVIEALKYVKSPFVLKLIGDHDESLKAYFESLFPYSVGHQLVWSHQIPASELQNEIAKHTIGVALEQLFPESRNTTVTNKILQYLQSGIKVIATRTEGQKEVADKMGEAVRLVDFNNAVQMAEAIEAALNDSFISSDSIIRKYDEFFSWESQCPILLDQVRKALI